MGDNEPMSDFYKDMPQYICALDDHAGLLEATVTKDAKKEVLGIVETLARCVRHEKMKVVRSGHCDNEPEFKNIVDSFNRAATLVCKNIFEKEKDSGKGNAKRVAALILDGQRLESGLFVASNMIELCRTAGWSEPLILAGLNCGNKDVSGMINTALKRVAAQPAKTDAEKVSPMRQIGNAGREKPVAVPVIAKQTPGVRIRNSMRSLFI
jgi:hypothetical protein